MRILLLAAALLCFGVPAAAKPSASTAPAADLQDADAQAFADVDARIRERLSDVQSVVVLLDGRVAYQYHRNGDANTLHDTQSVAKGALAALVGTALRDGRLASLDQAVVDLMPEWRERNADPRAATITVRHLLTMTAGFGVNDPAGIAAPLAPAEAWARPLRAAPGEAFAYDNSIIPMVVAILHKATGQPLAEHAREQLVGPMDMAAPQFRPGLFLRTIDMAKLGRLFLQDGAWNGRALLPPGFVAAATQPSSRGGPPVGLPYGQFWWVPSPDTFFASGYGGQFIWVHRPLNVVVAVTSTVSPASQQRGQARGLILGPLFEAVQKRAATR